MSSSDHLAGQLADCLLRIEMELRQLQLWEQERPPEEAFASTEPFCIDTLAFTQWLQFVFLERMSVLIENGSRCRRYPVLLPWRKSISGVRSNPAGG